jgi:hypothetical protein
VVFERIFQGSIVISHFRFRNVIQGILTLARTLKGIHHKEMQKGLQSEPDSLHNCYPTARLRRTSRMKHFNLLGSSDEQQKVIGISIGHQHPRDRPTLGVELSLHENDVLLRDGIGMSQIG